MKIDRRSYTLIGFILCGSRTEFDLDVVGRNVTPVICKVNVESIVSFWHGDCRRQLALFVSEQVERHPDNRHAVGAEYLEPVPFDSPPADGVRLTALHLAKHTAISASDQCNFIACRRRRMHNRRHDVLTN